VKKDIKILVADDHPILLKGLVREFKEHGYLFVLEAKNGATALELIKSEKPSIAVLDIEMPLLTGFEVIGKAKASGSKTRFVILTSHKEKAFILKAKQLTIDGYLLKDEPFSEMNKCIQSLLADTSYFSKTFESIFEEHVAPELVKLNFLSPSERTILRLVAQSKSSKEIGDIINISYRTVQKHRTNIINKLDLDTAPDALLLWAKANKELIASL
jgi:two-component system, NarL family, nitrate/nitrite response regulator NarL